MITEARRVLLAGGVLAAGSVSRLAVALDWLRSGAFEDEDARRIPGRIATVGSDDIGRGRACSSSTPSSSSAGSCMTVGLATW